MIPPVTGCSKWQIQYPLSFQDYVYKSIHDLNPKCIGGLFEEESTNYSLRNPVKLVQPMKRTSTYGLRSVSYTGAKLWNDLSPILSNDVEIEDFKSLMTILSTDHLDPTFTMNNSYKATILF